MKRRQSENLLLSTKVHGLRGKPLGPLSFQGKFPFVFPESFPEGLLSMGLMGQLDGDELAQVDALSGHQRWPPLLPHRGPEGAGLRHRKEGTQRGPGDLTQAQATVQAARFGAEWQARFLRERHILGLALQPPLPQPPAVAYVSRVATLEEVQALAAMAGRSLLEVDEELRIEGIPRDDHAPGVSPGQDLAVAVPAAVSGRDMEGLSMQAADWLGIHGLDLPQEPVARRRMLYVFANAMARARQGTKLRDEGEPVDTPPEVALPSSLKGPAISDLSAADKPATALRMRDLFELWRNKKPKVPAAKSVEVAARVVVLFEETLGNPPLVGLTRADGIKMRNAILATGVSARTAGNLFGWLITLLRFEIKNLRRIEVNPWDGLAVEGSNQRTQKRSVIKPEQFQTLFSQPLFKEYRLPQGRQNAGRDAAYWLPVMVAYTGARVTELAQMLVTDVKHDHGTWIMHIRVTYPNWQKLKGYYPGVTDGPSVRSFPVHSELVRLGFVEYAKAMRTAGHERLFPCIPVSEVNNAGGGFSSWFSDYKSSLGLGPEHTFHSFRHTVETLLKRKREHPFHINHVTGHAQRGGDADTTYTHLSAVDFVGTVELIQHEGVTLPKVWPPKEWIAPSAAEVVPIHGAPAK